MDAKHAAALSVVLALSPGADAQCRLTELVASDPVEHAGFGLSIDRSGYRIVVGAPTAAHLGLRAGAAYIYEDTGAGWVEAQRIVASDYGIDANFGYSVGLDGDWLVIGAPFAVQAAVLGKVYFFEDTAAGFVERASFLAANGGFADRYGWAVAIDGNVAAVGLPGLSRVVVYERNGNTWVETASLAPFGQPTGQWLMGNLVALDGDRILASAATWSSASSGSAFLFHRPAGTWVNEAQLIPSDAVPAQGFGSSIALFGDTAFVGAAPDSHLADGAGSVYVFEQAAPGWREAAKLTASDAAEGDAFGAQIALAADRALILASAEDDAEPAIGAVYSYERSGTGWLQRSKILPTHSHASFEAGLGASMVFDGDRAWISNAHAGTSPHAAGAVYEFSLRSTGAAECLATVNSTGAAAHITVSGCASIGANELMLIAAPVPDESGFFLYGSGSAQTPFGDGFLCVSAPVYRLDFTQTSANILMVRLDLTALPLDALPIVAGVTRIFQAWFRDTAQGGSGFNSTDARSITFGQ